MSTLRELVARGYQVEPAFQGAHKIRGFGIDVYVADDDTEAIDSIVATHEQRAEDQPEPLAGA